VQKLSQKALRQLALGRDESFGRSSGHDNISKLPKRHWEFLKIWLKPRWRHGHLEPFINDGAEYSIINGCWVHPHASRILENPEDNRICCIMMDATWSVIRECVTSI
jgi:hypothetical protein